MIAEISVRDYVQIVVMKFVLVVRELVPDPVQVVLEVAQEDVPEIVLMDAWEDALRAEALPLVLVARAVGVVMELNTKEENKIKRICFQVTEECCCKCDYCYEENKQFYNVMTFDTGKAIIDLLFAMWNENDDNNFINQNVTQVIFEFIGGEPTMNLDTIDYICDYFVQQCLKINHIWLSTWEIHLISNGTFYFSNKVQNFFNKFLKYLRLQISIDGPEYIHNLSRVYHDGTGQFKEAYNALKHAQSQNIPVGIKCTISPKTLPSIYHIVNFFIKEKVDYIYISLIAEYQWTIRESQIFYLELKKIADLFLKYNFIYKCSFFSEDIGQPLIDLQVPVLCGNTTTMIAFSPSGDAYPCIRFIASSLNNKQKEIKIGNYQSLYSTEQEQKYKNILQNLTISDIYPSNCIKCPIASGCRYCLAWGYQKTGDFKTRDTNICLMHKARYLANVYFWNNSYKQNKSGALKFLINLPKDEVIKIIGESEYNLLTQI